MIGKPAIQPRSHADDGMLKVSGILPADDARQSALRDAAWRMVERDRIPNGRTQTILSREWLSARGLSVALFLGLSDAEETRLCTWLHEHGHARLLGMPVDVNLAGAGPGTVWGIPNTPDEEGVPFNNFLLAHSGLATLVFAEADDFAFHMDEDGEVGILAGPADLIGFATQGDPAGALARYRQRATELESGEGRRYRPGTLNILADHYSPFLPHG